VWKFPWFNRKTKERLTVSKSQMQAAMHRAMVKAAEENIVEQLKSQGVPGTMSISWDIPCKPLKLDWPTNVWRGACEGRDIFLVD
jgi:hypothetical protein